MDIARPEFKTQKRRRQTIIVAAAVVGVATVSIGVSRLKPAAPAVERGTVWTDTVKRGPMLRQLRGLGSLVPVQESVRQIPAETEATVVRIHMLAGSLVKADTILLEMSNPQTEQAAVDAQLQLKAAEAEYQSLQVKLESDLMNQKTEAEAVAFVVCQSVGLQNGTASQDYIQLWHGDANLLRESLEAVQQTAAVILGGIAQGIAPEPAAVATAV